MASHASARRYARSLFDVVSRAGDPDAVLVELRDIVGVVTGNPELRRALESPGVPLGAKLTVMREVLGLQPISKVVARLMTLIVENDDINELDHIVEMYEQRVMELHQVVRADVTSAVPLSPERTRQLEEAFGAATGKRVVVSATVDSSIIGGIVTHIGSRVYDGSVVRHLERVRERLAAEQIL